VGLAFACSPSGGADGDAPRSFGLSRADQASGTQALLQAVSAVSPQVVWVSGHEGTWGRTLDGGGTWVTSVMAGADSLQFRDVDAFDERTAYLMSAGAGALSRIYKTVDGGASWELQFLNEHPDGFLDCMSFWDQDRGLAYGDSVDGVLFVLRTEDGGENWTLVEGDSLPLAQEGEGGFAASGSCVDTAPGGAAWIATGNADVARVLRTEDYGLTWSVAEVPVDGGPGGGLTTVGFPDGHWGFALGGIIGNDTVRSRNVAASGDGGRTWLEGGRLAMTGPVYGAALVPDLPLPTVFAVGPGGADWSPDGGRTWRSADPRTFWAVAFASQEAGWAVGPEGRITRFGFQTGGG
jgi:photosystem II stability/assembly factor-like uncharacterized protein